VNLWSLKWFLELKRVQKSIEIPNLTDGPILARSGPCGVARVQLGHGVMARRRPGCAGDTGGEAPNWGHHDGEETAASPFCNDGVLRAVEGGGFGDRRLASVLPAELHKKGECLGTVDGGEGWLAAAITKNGAAVEQGTDGGERWEPRWLEAALIEWWRQRVIGSKRAHFWLPEGGHGRRRSGLPALSFFERLQWRWQSLHEGRKGRKRRHWEALIAEGAVEGLEEGR
jgi:hypothetical protein